MMATERNGFGSRIVGWRVVGWGAAVGVLSVPLIAMQFTEEVNWTASDFAFAGALFGTVGLLIEWAVWRSSSSAYRVGVAAAALAGLLIIWANGAVGMIGSEDNSYNIWFGAPVLVALGGSIMARFRARGMARAMMAAAAIHASVAFGGMTVDPRGVVFSLLLSSFWLIAATCFQGSDSRRTTV